MSGIRIRTARKRTCTAMEMKTVHGLLVFLFFGFDTTISSNMVDDYLLPEVLGGICRLRCPGSIAGCGSGAGKPALSTPIMPGDDKRSCNTKTGVRSYHNPHHQGK